MAAAPAVPSGAEAGVVQWQLVETRSESQASSAGEQDAFRPADSPNLSWQRLDLSTASVALLLSCRLGP
jgi:hypothetical protein